GPHPVASGNPPAAAWRGRRDRSRVRRRRDDPPHRNTRALPRPRFWRAVADLLAARPRAGRAGMKRRSQPRDDAPAADGVVMALPNGRILGEVMSLLGKVGIAPEPAFSDPDTRQLRFRTSDSGLDLIRVRSFDVASFVAFGAAQLGVAGN